MLIEYEGSRYHGFQVQNDVPTIQGELEKAITSVSGESRRIQGAGRTDAGVHARGQVAAFDTDSALSPLEWEKALNFYLESDIAVREACLMEPNFDPRRDAQNRKYEYTILNRTARSPLNDKYSYHVERKLDVARMNEAAKTMEGEHDFISFTNQEGSTKNTIRNVYRAGVRREDEFVRFDIKANAFLPQQVRRIVGSLIKIGAGDIDITELKQIMASGIPGRAREVAPAHGLCLMKVNYPEIGFSHENL
ncbi:MAG: tRNA pseudouridine(38-40) synthase TruA [Dehalococcoidia bacterium]